MERVWNKVKGGYIDTEGTYGVFVKSVEVSPNNPNVEPKEITVTFSTLNEEIYTNKFRFTKKDGSPNYGAMKSFERFLETVLGAGFTSWSEDKVVGCFVDIVLVENSWENDGVVKTFLNLDRVEPYTAEEVAEQVSDDIDFESI